MRSSQSEREMLLESMDYKDASQVPEIKMQADNLEKRLRAPNQKTESLKQQRDSVLEQYDAAAREGNNRFDPLAIYKARKEIRPEKEDEIKDKLWDEYGPNYSLFMLADSTRRQETCWMKKPRNDGLNGNCGGRKMNRSEKNILRRKIAKRMIGNDNNGDSFVFLLHH